MYCLSSRGQNSEMKVTAGRVPPVGSEGQCVPGLSPGFWWFAAILAVPGLVEAPPQPLSSAPHAVLPVCMSVSKFPLLIRTSHVGVGAHPTPVLPHNMANYTLNDPISK